MAFEPLPRRRRGQEERRDARRVPPSGDGRTTVAEVDTRHVDTRRDELESLGRTSWDLTTKTSPSLPLSLLLLFRVYQNNCRCSTSYPPKAFLPFFKNSIQHTFRSLLFFFIDSGLRARFREREREKKRRVSLSVCLGDPERVKVGKKSNPSLSTYEKRRT